MKALSNALLFGAAICISASLPAATVVVTDASSDLHDTGGCAETGTGLCSLRDAVTFTNATAGADEIHFAIPGAEVQTITGTFEITDAVTIDGYTQPGATPNTNGPWLGDNAVLKIEIQGGIQVRSGPTVIRGLVVNNGGGIEVTSASQTVIEGNFIGTDSTGTLARPNDAGLRISPCDTLIGASASATDAEAAAARNIISGNDGRGIELYPGPVLIAGNFIGTDSSGAKALGNKFEAITFFDINDDIGCVGHLLNVMQIGGTTPNLRNVISGNHNLAIYSEFVVIQGNFIGTDVSGRLAVPNAGGISTHSGAVIGGPEPGAGNLISGNTGTGVFLEGPNGAGHVEGNRIGTDVTGKEPLGNGYAGVIVNEAEQHFVARNLIAFNGFRSANGAGVIVGPYETFFTPSGALLGNAIYSNSSDGSVSNRGIGIDLGSDGPTANDDCDDDEGPDGFQNTPTLLGVTASSSGTRIQGYVNSSPLTSFHIEFFSNSGCDPSGSGPGEVFLGSAEVSTDASCVALIDATLPVQMPAGRFVTATATGVLGTRLANTSELSGCVAVAQATLDVASLSPGTGPSSGQADVNLSGLGFEPGATVVVGGTVVSTPAVLSPLLIVASVPALAPGTLNDVIVTNPDSSSAALPGGWMTDFADVGGSHAFHAAIERIFRAGITAGCGAGDFCPDGGVLRDQMAIFLARAMAGGGAKVPSAGTVNGKPYDCKPGGISLFSDVAPTDAFCKHAHYLAAWKVSLGCSATEFCPSAPVNRQGIAGLVARALIAPDWTPVPLAYGPDPVTGRSYSCDAGSSNVQFTDVPTSNPFCKHVHYLWARGVVSGCAADRYCPSEGATRAQMAKFLANAFVP